MSVVTSLPNLDKSQQEAVQSIFKHDQEQLKRWEAKRQEAEENVKYWTIQVNSSSIALRVTMENQKP